MATRLKEVDAVMIGMGWTGSIMARELTKAGLTVVGLERGEDLTPGDHFALPRIRDELKYTYRLELVQDPALETITFRHRRSDLALPMRRMGHSCRATAWVGPPITGAACTGAICPAITSAAAISLRATAPRSFPRT
jgi:choline dehydrogenase-like flavoprotein